MSLFFLPILGKEYAQTVPDILVGKRTQINWYGKNNPLGFSPELIGFIKSLPPGKTFITDPLGKSCLFIYAPHYTASIPHVIGTIVKDVDVYREAVRGMNPLFNTAVQTEKKEVLHENAAHWIESQKAECILIEDAYYSPLLSYFKKHPDCYHVIFDNPEGSEAVISTRKMQ
jgi:hypothetical protein